MKNGIIFYLSTNKKLASSIAKISGMPLGDCELVHFSDGEIMVRNLSSVAGKTVYIIQSTVAPASESLLEIFIAIDAFKNSNAKEIITVIPYFGFSRQDRVARPGEPISAKVVAGLLQAAGTDRVISVDLHTQQIQGFFSCPVQNIDTFDLFGAYFVDKFNELGIKGQDVVVVSPDHGSALRARDLGSAFTDASIAFIDKRRPAPNKSEVISVVGDVKGKTCVIIDDIIDTCGTINNAVEAIFRKGAKEIFVCATHAIFSANEIDKRVKEVIVTDSVEKELKGVKVLSIAKLISEAITKE